MVMLRTAFLSLPAFEDADKTRTAQTLHRLLQLSAGLLLFLFAAYAVDVDRTPALIGFTLLLFLVIPILMALNRRGYVELSSMAFALNIWMVLTVVNAWAGGVRTPFFTIYYLPIMLATLLCGWRRAVIMVTLTLAAGVGMVVAESWYGPRPPVDYGAVSLLAIHGVSLAFTIMLISLSSRDTQQATEESRRHAAQFEALYRGALDISADLHLDSLLQTLTDSTLSLMNATGGGVYLYDPKRDALVWTVAGGKTAPPGMSLRHGEGLSGKIWATGQPAIVNNYAKWKGRSPAYDGFDYGAIAAAPIQWRDEFLGVIVATADEAHTFGEAHLSLLSLFALQAAVAIKNAHLYQQVQDHAAKLEARVQTRTAELSAANERLETLSRLKDEFVSNVSHELRTPLANIILNLELLSIDPERHDEHETRLQREAKRLAELIEDLLRLSRLDQGRVELKREAVDLKMLARNYGFDRGPLAAQHGLTLNVQTIPDCPVVLADRNLLDQILSILLTNAFSYTPSGGCVTIQTHRKQSENGCLAGISVTDTGPGIAPDDLPHIFDRFYRGKGAQNSGASGTGLGLAIAKEIAERHGGSIGAANTDGPTSGATFTVWLPAQPES